MRLGWGDVAPLLSEVAGHMVAAELSRRPTVAAFDKAPPDSPRPREPCHGAALRPPVLRRQNASRFSWPPDASNHWTYISFSPDEFSRQLRLVRAQHVSAHEVARFFDAYIPSDVSGPAAYCEYARGWRSEIQALRCRAQP